MRGWRVGRPGELQAINFSAMPAFTTKTASALTVVIALSAAGLGLPASAQLGQVSGAVRSANLQRALAPRPAGVSQTEHLKAIDRFVLALPQDQMYALEMDTWGILFAQQKITRLEFAQNMAATNAKFAPRDVIARDYWRYVTGIAAQADAGDITDAQYQVLADRKFRESTVVHEAARRREQAADDAQKTQNAQNTQNTQKMQKKQAEGSRQ